MNREAFEAWFKKEHLSMMAHAKYLECWQAALASQAQQSQWISVEEAKATLKDGDLIFAYCEFYGVIEATYAFEEGYYNPHRIVKKNGDSYRINTFTHFMVRKPTSLPPAPEGE